MNPGSTGRDLGPSWTRLAGKATNGDSCAFSNVLCTDARMPTPRAILARLSRDELLGVLDACNGLVRYHPAFGDL